MANEELSGVQDQSKNPVGRPELDIDDEEVLKLAKMGCTVQEMADFFGCSKDTLERRYGNTYRKGMANVKMSLRRSMLRNAIENNNSSVQIWLSKQYLGMREPKLDVDFSTGMDEILFSDDN